jgi:hypothetical protein
VSEDGVASIFQHYFTRRTKLDAVASTELPRMETKMRKAAFTILAALLIAGSAVQMATASEHHKRAGQGHPRWDRAYNATPQIRDSYGKPPADVSQSCDIKWCYAD